MSLSTMYKLLNYTGHDINLLLGDKVVILPSKGLIKTLRDNNPEVESIETTIGTVYARIETPSSEKKVIGIPDKIPSNVIFIVGNITAHDLKEIGSNLPIIYPDTGPNSVVYKKDGTINYITRFIQFKKRG
jgi:hypothetical protein